MVAQTILLEVLVDGNILQEERTSSVGENRSTTPLLVGQNLQFVVDINMGREINFTMPKYLDFTTRSP